MSPLEALVALNMLPGIGPIRCRRLIQHFGSAMEVLRASREACLHVQGIGAQTVNTLMSWQDHCDPAAEIANARRRGIDLITAESQMYPALLRESYDAPILLYCMGKLEAADHQAIGVVGSRRCSHYGLQSTRKLTYQLASNGQTIVSGLARGIDTAAHEAALAAGGRTIAIIGSGFDHLYPAENEQLAERIASGHGAVVSEYPLHTRPDRGTFPMRNRIIAAWSQAVLVIECSEKSGALITANLAGEYGRPLFVLPGQIDRANFAGSHRLIRDGATLVTDASHIVEDLGGIHFATATADPESGCASPALNSEQSMMLEHISRDPMTTDELIEASGLQASIVTRCLAMLEIHGLVESLPGSRYCKRRAN